MAEWGWPCAIVPGFSIGVPGQNEISKQIDSLRRQEKKQKGRYIQLVWMVKNYLHSLILTIYWKLIHI